MLLTIARTHETLFSGEAVSITVPTTAGIVTILGNHEPLVATLAPGIALVRSQAGEESFDVDSGVLEVSSNQVTVLL